MLGRPLLPWRGASSVHWARGRMTHKAPSDQSEASLCQDLNLLTEIRGVAELASPCQGLDLLTETCQGTEAGTSYIRIG